MRILFWNELFAPAVGGVEIFTARLAAGLIRRGHEIAVVAAQFPAALPRHDVVDGIEVHRLPFFSAFRAPGNDPADARATVNAIVDTMTRAVTLKRRFQPDVVHVNLCGASSHFHWRTAKAHPSATVVTFQAALTPGVAADELIKTTVREAAHIVAVSHWAAMNAAATTGVALERIAVIAPGIPSDEFTPRPDGCDAENPIFTFLGRLVPDKGADLAIAAAVRLRKQCKIRLRLIGDGPERSALAQQIRAHGAEDFIEILGHVDADRRRSLLSESFALLVPSRHHELFGMVAAEGGMSGVPVIVARNGGLPEVVKDRETGIVVAPNDSDALAAAMLGLVRDPAWARQLGQAGRARALAEFSIDTTVERYERLYDSGNDKFRRGAEGATGREIMDQGVRA